MYKTFPHFPKNSRKSMTLKGSCKPSQKLGELLFRNANTVKVAILSPES